MPDAATPTATDVWWVDELPPEYRDCRGFKHQFGPETMSVRDFPTGEVGLLMKCPRCGCFRYDLVEGPDAGNDEGTLIKRRYSLPPGYRKPPKAPLGSTPTRAELMRMTLVGRRRIKSRSATSDEAEHFDSLVAEYLGRER